MDFFFLCKMQPQDGVERIQNGKVIDLTPEARNSTAADINNLGQVVGTADNQPFLYSDGKLINSNTLLDPNAYWRMTTPIAINDAGQIPEAPGAAMLLAGVATLWLGFARNRGAYPI